jgi:carbamoyltransferase
MAEVYLGIARARLGPAAALLDPGRGAVVACEENRLSRARQAPTSGPPELAIAELLAATGRTAADIGTTGIVRDPDMTHWPTPGVAIDVDAHVAHAAYALRVASRPHAVCVVCDASHPDGWSAWHRSPSGAPVRITTAAGRFPVAQIYSCLTAALGYQPARDEHLVEAMARAGRVGDEYSAYVEMDDGGIRVPATFQERVDAAVRQAADPERVRRDIAASVQHRLGEGIVELLRRVFRTGNVDPAITALSLSGGVFFNTHFTTAAASARMFDTTVVAPHPGRNGAAVGAAVVAGAPAAAGLASPYLGPVYGVKAIKDALDNCKLSYDLLRTDKVYETTLRALGRGRLIGWYHGAMEWGPRALGHRSVLADPFAPHVLDNLNGFLKQRPSHRGYGVSVPVARLGEFFEGPPASPYMQFEYRPRDPDRFRTILPPGVERLRVHSVDDTEPRFLRLLELWGEKAGLPILVNTSFNGFHEPLVCSPRDAIRVFFGTGLDVLVLEDFVLHK